MFYYETALSGLRLAPLTYAYDRPLEPGAEVIAPLSGKPRSGYILRAVEKPGFDCETLQAITDRQIDAPRLATARFLAEYYGCELAEALALFTPAPPASPQTGPIDTQIILSADQQAALDFISRPKPALLFGDTGSGKSEIYMKLFERVLNEGKTALFLMPEISLTPQIESRLKAHFGKAIALWHSKVTKAKKTKVLEGLASGEVRIVAGARSALFLPMPRLGAIVVDEEHDDSYKAQNRPRYHARDAACVLGRELNIPVVLGSATPSLTSYARFERFRLRGQYFSEGTRRYEFIAGANEEPSPAVLAALEATLKRGKQAIVFLPTRANFKYLVCATCGSNVKCPFCEVGMSLHSKKRALKCHYCNYASPIVQACPECGSDTLIANRHGTAEIVKLLQEHFPNAAIGQFDRDAVTTDGKLRAILKAFNDGQTQILVGTQMLSKGHNYHDVELAVVLGLDRILALPEFRAHERAVSLLVQIAGRAGRKGDARVLVQTMNEASFAPHLADYETFLRQELHARRELWPPHARLLRLVIAHADAAKARAVMDKSVAALAQQKGIETVGFGECAISRITNKYRYYILLRGQSPRALIQAARSVENPLIEAEIDPLNFT
ncbi:MAG: primosomal protein N' [Campylobacterales bacterium]